ncbi:sugar kinase [Arsukibacterium ikkense]|uniref:Sugar kinase n=1 Tax=Arsukibacterium ikkense TaxID=336831 RepID=A0A0M2V5E8_9GAMM|nr:carbohydrate kinase [Arsukibacterium ikkense]KKO45851.1 sugar kinase [Arsukibacterium ikkense]
MSLPVYCFGEVLIDFLQDPQQPGVFRRFAGGAPANVAVAVAKLGGQGRFVGMLGADMFGEFLQAELQHYGVDCHACATTTAAKTALAFVALNDDGDRSFSFYRPPAADLLYTTAHLPADFWQTPAILHLCSNSLTDSAIASTSFNMVQQAHQHGWLVSVDANLRHNLWASGKADATLVQQLLEQADIIKLSDDELSYLAQQQTENRWLKQLQAKRNSWIVVTAGSKAVNSYSPQPFSLPVSAVKVVDTTAAGDAFVGAWLYQLSHSLTAQSWPQLLKDKSLQQLMLSKAIKAGSLTCQHFGAFTALPTRF